MTTRKQRESVYAYPLQWPDGWPRCKIRGDSRSRWRSTSRGGTLLDEISMMAGNFRLSHERAAPHGRRTAGG